MPGDKMLLTKNTPPLAATHQVARFAVPDKTHALQRRLIVGITSDQTCLVLRNRLRVLKSAGFQVLLVSSPGQRLNETVKDEGVPAVALPMSRDFSPLADIVSFIKVFWVILRQRPDITDFSTPKAGLLGNVAAWLLRVPHRVYTLRGLKLEGTEGHKRRLLLWTERIACGCAHVVLCNSESLCRKSESLRLVRPDKLRLLGNGSSNGVDTERFCPGPSEVRNRLHIAPGDPVLGFVGRLTKDKGLSELLIAFDQILVKQPRAWLLLVGWFDLADDALDEHSRHHIATHPRIRHTGFVENTAPYYRAMDLMILPTYREGFPNVVLEASATAIPSIATDCTGARDSVISEVTGLLIQPGIPEAISDAVLELLSDENKRRRMGIAARQWVLDFYDQRKVLDLAVGFYRDLLEG